MEWDSGGHFLAHNQNSLLSLKMVPQPINGTLFSKSNCINEYRKKENKSRYMLLHLLFRITGCELMIWLLLWITMTMDL